MSVPAVPPASAPAAAPVGAAAFSAAFGAAGGSGMRASGRSVAVRADPTLGSSFVLMTNLHGIVLVDGAQIRDRLDTACPPLPLFPMAANVRLGTQGWNYDAWVGPLYPEGTRPADFLSVYSRAFQTVEVDSTFYAIPPAKTFRSW